MAEVGSAYLTVIPKGPAGGFTSALNSSFGGSFTKAGQEGGRKMGQGVETGGKKSFGAAAMKIGGAFAAAFAAVGVTQVLSSVVTSVKDFTMESISLASDLQESVNAVNVSYGEHAAGILAIAENAATGLGLSKQEFNGIAVQFSAFAQQIAGDGGDVAGTMETLALRGADFASVMNLDVNEALSLFQSGLAGETEPLRKYGVDLSAASVEAHALAVGIWDGTGAMTESEKVMARYSLLMEQTNKVAGDFANTSDSLANRKRILAAEVENAKAAIGESLLPVMEQFYGWALDYGVPILKDLASWFEENQDAIMNMATAGVEATLSLIAAFLDFGAQVSGVVEYSAEMMGGLTRFLFDGFAIPIMGALWDLAGVFDTVFRTDIQSQLAGSAANLIGYRDTAVLTLETAQVKARQSKAAFQEAASGVRELRNEIGKVQSKDVRINVHTVYTTTGKLDTVIRPGQVGMRAHGGPVAAGAPYVVGEYEPELFVPDRPGVVLNQEQLRSIGAGSGPVRLAQESVDDLAGVVLAGAGAVGRESARHSVRYARQGVTR